MSLVQQLKSARVSLNLVSLKYVRKKVPVSLFSKYFPVFRCHRRSKIIGFNNPKRPWYPLFSGVQQHQIKWHEIVEHLNCEVQQSKTALVSLIFWCSTTPKRRNKRSETAFGISCWPPFTYFERNNRFDPWCHLNVLNVLNPRKKTTLIWYLKQIHCDCKTHSYVHCTVSIWLSGKAVLK